MIGKTISHYRIVEKLGEGGMGIVFKAHDTKLDRMVALKFLPNYLTSDVTEKERFYHEARAASALMHPNVAVIFEINEFEGQIFLAMEYVEGQTLKKLVGQDALSIKKVLDISIQACEGLAAAHEKGIVHRDIKSDNIMITPKGQVKIMDFGLAKVKGATKLTKAGSTIGTAAYMSPEQAQGEEVDHRSDIFSFGVVLYELLTTKLPFRGEHQAALLYSLVNEEPQPLARFNEKVTPDLERIVMKAMAKEKDERYQHADDMLADLRRERKNLEYARAGYATTSTITQVQQAIPASVPRKPGKSVLRYIIPAAVVVIAVVLFAIFNPFNFELTTQKTTAAAPEKSSLAVMYFQNIPDPEDKDHTGDMLSDLLITSLSQSKGLEVISRERLFDIQKELQTDSKSISPEMATKIARRAGVTTMLLGTILQEEPELAITVRLIDVKSGNIINSERVTGFTAKQIFSLVDTLALLVRKDLQIATASPVEAKSVAEVTTKSPEAYRSYIEGIELNNRFYTSEAVAAFRRAIELDTNFAMAYYRLATANLNTLSLNEYARTMKKAYTLSGTVTERERLLIQSTYVSDFERNYPKAISILESLIERYPLDDAAYMGLSFLYRQQGQFEKVGQIFAKKTQIDSLNKTAWNNLAYSYTLLGRRQEAFQAIDRYLQLAPAEANPYDSKGDLYAMFDERDSALIWWQKAIAFRADFPSGAKLSESALTRQDYVAAEKYFRQFAASNRDEEALYNEMFPVILQVYQGKIDKARNDFLKLVESHKRKNLYDWLVGDLRILVALDYELRDYPGMLRHAQELSDELQKDTGNNPGYGKMIVAIAQSANGYHQASSGIIDSMRNLAGDDPAVRRNFAYGLAIILLAEGKNDAAMQQFASVMKLSPPHHVPLYFHAVCKLKAGSAADAISELHRLARWSPIRYDPFELGRLPMSEYEMFGSIKAHYWLGVAYESQGKRTDAIREYEKFLEIWKDADFDSRELKDAKTRVTALKSKA